MQVITDLIYEKYLLNKENDTIHYHLKKHQETAKELFTG